MSTYLCSPSGSILCNRLSSFHFPPSHQTLFYHWGFIYAVPLLEDSTHHTHCLPPKRQTYPSDFTSNITSLEAFTELPTRSDSHYDIYPQQHEALTGSTYLSYNFIFCVWSNFDQCLIHYTISSLSLWKWYLFFANTVSILHNVIQSIRKRA